MFLAALFFLLSLPRNSFEIKKEKKKRNFKTLFLVRFYGPAWRCLVIFGKRYGECRAGYYVFPSFWRSGSILTIRATRALIWFQIFDEISLLFLFGSRKKKANSSLTLYTLSSKRHFFWVLSITKFWLIRLSIYLLHPQQEPHWLWRFSNMISSYPSVTETRKIKIRHTLTHKRKTRLMVAFCIGRHFSLDSVMNVPKERSRWRKNKERKMSLKAKVGDWRKSVDVHSMWVVCKRTQTSWIITERDRKRRAMEIYRQCHNEELPVWRQVPLGQ